jgi:hypothetical protein
MRRKGFAGLFLTGIVMLCACSRQEAIPGPYNTEVGSYTMGPEVNPSAIVLNGNNALKGAFIFNEKATHLAISSQGDLDIISAIKRDTSGASIQVTLANTGKEIEEIAQLTIMDMGIDGMGGVAVLSDHVVEIGDINSSPSGICLRTSSTETWQFRFTLQGERIDCSLDLSASSIILLPGEEISLPPLNFFYHLCAD